MRESVHPPAKQNLHGGSRWARFFAGAALPHHAKDSTVQQNPGPAARLPCAVAILPAGQGQRFTLNNRSSLAAWLRARRFTTATPDSLDFDATTSLLAHATLVLLADPTDAAMLGLCPRGTKVLEIAPEGWATGQIRAFCSALGLEWHLFLATPPSYPLLQPLPFGATTAMSYEIPLSALGQTLGAL